MKRLLSLASLFLLLTACTEKPVVDFEKEFDKIPEITMSWDGMPEVPSVPGSFCVDSLCWDVGEPDWEVMTFTPVMNGTPLTVQISSDYEFSEINFTLKNMEGNTIQNNIPYTDNSDGTYTIDDSFKQTGELVFSVKVNFVEGGYSQIYFPLSVQ